MLTLQSNEDHSSHDRDEVQRQIHDVSDDSLGAEALEGVLEDLAELGHGVTARLELSALGDEVGGVLGDQGAVEDIQQSVLKDEGLGNHVDNGRALAQNQEASGEDGDGAVDEDHQGELRQVGEGEHGRKNADAQCQGRNELLPEGLP